MMFLEGLKMGVSRVFRKECFFFFVMIWEGCLDQWCFGSDVRGVWERAFLWKSRNKSDRGHNRCLLSTPYNSTNDAYLQLVSGPGYKEMSRQIADCYNPF